MVYCHSCGTENQENAVHCSNCGKELYPTTTGEIPRSKKKKKEEDCFGLPYGNAIWGLLCGSIIIISGLSWFLGMDLSILWSTTIGPFIIIFIGILIIAGAIYSITRKNR